MMKMYWNEENKETLQEVIGFREFYNNAEDVYFKIGDYSYCYRLLTDCVVLKDITNGGKIGKDCYEYRIFFNHLDDLKPLYACNFDDIFFHIFGNTQENLDVKKYAVKAIDVFNPFNVKDVYKPLKEEPKKWTLRHAIRAIINQQFENLKCDGYYTDDYAFDDAVNYRRGEIKRTDEFLRKIIEHKSGWKVYKSFYSDDNRVNINCYSFDCNSFIPKIA